MDTACPILMKSVYPCDQLIIGSVRLPGALCCSFLKTLSEVQCSQSYTAHGGTIFRFCWQYKG